MNRVIALGWVVLAVCLVGCHPDPADTPHVVYSGDQPPGDPTLVVQVGFWREAESPLQLKIERAAKPGEVLQFEGTVECPVKEAAGVRTVILREAGSQQQLVEVVLQEAEELAEGNYHFEVVVKGPAEPGDYRVHLEWKRSGIEESIPLGAGLLLVR